MAEDEVIQQLYRFDIDSAALARARSGIASAKQYVDDLTEAIKGQPVTLDATNAALDDYVQKTKQSSTQTADTSDNIEKMTSRLTELEDASTSATAAQEKLATANKDVGDSSGGGDSAGVTSLRRTGGALSQLGFQGAGRGLQLAGDIQQLNRFQESLSGITPELAGAGVATIALTAVIDLYTQQQQKAKEAALGEITARESAIQIIATGTKEDQQAKLNQLETTRKANQAIADDTNQLYASLIKGILDTKGITEAGLEVSLAKIGQADGTVQAAYDAAQKANKALDGTSTEMNILTQATGLTAQSTADLTAAEASLKAKRQEVADSIKGIEDSLAGQKEAQQQINTGSVQGLAQRKKDIYDELQLLNEASAATAQKIKDSEGDTEAQAAYRDELKKLDGQFQSLSTTYDDLSTSIVENAVAANDAAKELKQSNDEKIADTKAYNDDIKKIEDTSDQARAKAAGTLADALVKAATTAADAAEAALNKLIDKRADLAKNLVQADEDAETKAEQQKLDDQIKRAQEEVKAAREHERTLKQIRADGARSEQQAIDDRDFAQLFQIRDNVNQQLSAENDRYKQQEEDRQESYKQQDADRDTAEKRDHEARLKKYQRDTADATAQYNKEITAAAANKTKQLNLAQQAYNTEITNLRGKLIADENLRLQAYDTEIKNANAVGDERIAIEQRISDALLAQANARLAAITNMTSTAGSSAEVAARAAMRASGGSLNAGQLSSYNERGGQREKFNGQLLPAGAGLIMPFRGGYMDSNGGGKSPININGPLSAPTIYAGAANSAQLESIKRVAFEGALDALLTISGGSVNGSPS